MIEQLEQLCRHRNYSFRIEFDAGGNVITSDPYHVIVNDEECERIYHGYGATADEAIIAVMRQMGEQ